MDKGKLHKIYESTNSTIYKGKHANFSKEVIVKVLNTEYPTEEQITRFNNEYEFTCNLEIPGVRKVLKKESERGKNSLILEYFDGETLTQFISKNKKNTKTLLKTAINIIQTIGEIHQHNITHKDLNPHNILTNKQGEIKIIDFGLASKHSLKIHNLSNPEHLEGTLAYISPEQTGRVNRAVDFRSDLYSVGVVLYEMFTGELPFQHSDSMQLVHAHIAKEPTPLQEINKEIPKILSDIVLKLLSKNADERYQSAFGLKYDLEQLLNFTDSENPQTFILGEKDFSGRLTIPIKTYGREDEINRILQSYKRTSNGSTEVVLISGNSGVGKSVTVREIIPDVYEDNGVFISGKFDEFQKDIPLYAFRHIFNEFIGIILKEKEEKLNYWKSLIQKAVGNLGKILTDTFPELKLIIGEQADIPELEGKEALNRFNFLWINFIKSIAKAEHPLVLFLINMQWADKASIDLLKILLSDKEINYFLCIKSFNPRKISENNQFNILKQGLKKEDINLNEIEIKNLEKKDISNLLIDSLHSENPQGFGELADLTFSKTSGNPFFTIEFLKTIYEEELLQFDFKNKFWLWKSEEIKNYNVTDNVVELLSSKIKQLPAQTQKILEIAACVGNKFDLIIISEISQKDIEETRTDLEYAIVEGIISSVNTRTFKFVHDTLFQAVYSLITEIEKKQFHLRVGQILLKNTPEKMLVKNIFQIVNQLNYSVDLISDVSEKQRLAVLNYIASQRAKHAVAYQNAYQYLITAKTLLPKNCWQSDYNFTLKFFNALAEFAYLTGKYNKTEKYVKYVIKNAKEILDTIQVYSIQIQSYTSKTKYENAIETGIEIIGQLGTKIPINPGKAKVVQEFIKTQIAVTGKKAEDFAKLPLMTNKKQLAIVKLINSIGSAVYLGSPDIFPILIFKSIRIFVKYGNCFNSPYIYSGYGIILTIMNKFDKGIIFGNLAKELISPLKAKQDSAKINFLINSFNKVWKIPIQNLAKPVYNTYKIGIEFGDLEYASYGLMNIFLQFHHNKPIKQIKNEALGKIETLKKLKQEFSLQYVLHYIQVCENLISIKDNPSSLKGEYFNDDIQIQKVIKNKNHSNLSNFYVSKLLLHIIFNDLNNTKEYLSELEKLEDVNKGSYFYAINNFYRSLIYIRHYENKKDVRFLRKLNKNQRQMKMWAKHCSENFQHKFYLIEAEKLRVLGKPERAILFYDRAISGANKNQFLCEEALSWELAANFYLEQNNATITQTYIQNAYNCYKRWGATAKCKQLEDSYDLFSFQKRNPDSPYNRANATIIQNTATVESSSFLDLTSIVKASQSLSGEVKLEKLLKSILILIMENAGADYAVIIKNDEGKYTVEARGKHGSERMEVLQSEDLEKTKAVDLSIIKYVIRSRKFLVIDNASKDTQYSKNEYISENKVKSVFCYPVIHKNKLVAILYLENNLSSHVFTSKRIETINVLSSQIAVSIENALLYENLEGKVKVRTKELHKANDELNQANNELQTTIELVQEQKGEIENQKTEVEHAHKHITDSINYASRIQNAILPAVKLFEDNFSDHFILFKPRDVVSGDFYWAKQINGQIIIAAADCTGHGVPGAFVSLLGISFLNEIAGKSEVITAAKILEELRIQIKTSLQQTGDRNESKDGMDIALCIIDNQTRQMQYAGAYNSIYMVLTNENRNRRIEELSKNPKVIIHNHYSEPEIESDDQTSKLLIEVKATRNPIGIFLKEKPFENNEIQLLKGDILYMFSDGYADQFGGKYETKFLTKRFKKIITDVSDKPLYLQKKILNTTIENWKKNLLQNDDMLVIGFEIK